LSDDWPLPADVVALLDGNDLEARIGLTIELLSAGEDGWPRVALLSAGEVLAVSDETVRLALWPQSHTTENLTRTGKGVLAFVHDGAAYNVRLRAIRSPDLPGPLAAFEGSVAEFRRDEVGYARLTNGITFELPDAPAVVARWRETIEALRNQ
jgi:flavin reductase (DIM6/NTAB) family NADH-FMN oxidoreductase RutF